MARCCGRCHLGQRSLARVQPGYTRGARHELRGDRAAAQHRRAAGSEPRPKISSLPLSNSRGAVRLEATNPHKEDMMKYVLLIHQGDTPTPNHPEDWGRLSEAEQNQVFADYQAINQTTGVTPGLGLAEPQTATTVRVQNGQTLTTDGPFVGDQGGAGRLPDLRGRRPRRRHRARGADPGRAAGRRDRGAPGRLSGSTARAGLPRPVGTCSGDADRPPRRLRPRRGGRPGGVRGGRRAVAARGHPGEPQRVADLDRPQPRDRPAAPRPDAGEEDARCSTARGGDRGPDGPRRPSPTSGWS